MGRTATYKKQTNLAGRTIISYYVKVSPGESFGPARAKARDQANLRWEICPKKPTNAEPTQRKNQPRGLATTKLTFIFTAQIVL